MSATLAGRRPAAPGRPARGRLAPGRLAQRRGPAAWLTLSALVVVTVTILIPFALIALNAFKPPAQYSAHGPLSFPDGFYTGGIRQFWDTADFGRALWNSAAISGCVSAAAVLLSILNAYALGIGRVKGRTPILGAFLIANFLPQEGLVYPLYDLAKEFGLYDSRLAVIIIFTVIQAAFGTYLLSSVLSSASLPNCLRRRGWTGPGGRASCGAWWCRSAVRSSACCSSSSSSGPGTSSSCRWSSWSRTPTRPFPSRSARCRASTS